MSKTREHWIVADKNTRVAVYADIPKRKFDPQKDADVLYKFIKEDVHHITRKILVEMLQHEEARKL